MMTLVPKFMVYRALSDKTYLFLGLRSSLTFFSLTKPSCFFWQKNLINKKRFMWSTRVLLLKYLGWKLTIYGKEAPLLEESSLNCD